MRQTWPLKNVASMEAKSGVISGEEVEFVELTLSAPTSFGDNKATFQMAGASARTKLIGTIYLFCK